MIQNSIHPEVAWKILFLLLSVFNKYPDETFQKLQKGRSCQRSPHLFCADMAGPFLITAFRGDGEITNLAKPGAPQVKEKVLPHG